MASPPFESSPPELPFRVVHTTIYKATRDNQNIGVYYDQQKISRRQTCIKKHRHQTMLNNNRRNSRRRRSKTHRMQGLKFKILIPRINNGIRR
ncbi:hypothetical protein Hanom_Chr04g00364371 [Helianthus anomalus]